MPENVGLVTELIANYCYKALGLTVLRPTGVNLCMVLNLAFRGMCSCILRHGNVLTVAIMRHFGL